MIDTDLSTFERFWALGFRRLVPVVPPDAEISTHSTLYKRAGAPPHQQKSGETKSRWTEARLTEPWAEWRAKRKAERAGSDAR